MDDPLTSGKLQAKKRSVDGGSVSERFLTGFVGSWALEYNHVAAEDGSNEDLKVTIVTFLAMVAL